ncbi:unnamed protein product [Hymenolepis diminuta]|uniref:Uncharacterized protein n=1 Tax=Hymenolepis diminuta TaxID=6216 RepID=A0A564YMC9_HYMDI|nr:unnamed protein product [Hymenolepis diminuta]
MSYLSAGETRSSSNDYPTNIRSRHSQDTDFVENVGIIETVPSKTSLPELSTLAPISNAVLLYLWMRC